MDTQHLAALIDNKHAVLRRLREVAQRQLALAVGGDPRPLVSLLAVKQKLLDELTSTERDLNPYREQDPQQRQWPSPQSRERCAAVSQACRDLLAEVMDLDRRATEQLRQRQQQTKVQIDAAEQAAQARSAYFASAAPAPQQFDVASES